MYVIDIQGQEPICRMQHFPNEPIHRNGPNRSQTACRAISDGVPPHGALTRTIIQGGMNSNGPVSRSGTGFKRRGAITAAE